MSQSATFGSCVSFTCVVNSCKLHNLYFVVDTQTYCLLQENEWSESVNCSVKNSNMSYTASLFICVKGDEWEHIQQVPIFCIAIVPPTMTNDTIESKNVKSNEAVLNITNGKTLTSSYCFECVWLQQLSHFNYILQ